MSIRSSVYGLALFVLLSGGAVRAEQKRDARKGRDDEGSITAGWDGSHPFIKSTDGNFEMEIGGRLHRD